MPPKQAETDSDVTKQITGCLFDIGKGKTCGAEMRARGFCRKHYAQLARKGAFRPGTEAPADPKTAADVNLGHLARARSVIEQHSETFVKYLLMAAKVAARKGDSKPAEWALLHSRTLEPIAAAPKGPQNELQGVRVLIGVQLGGTVTGTPALDVRGAAAPSTYVQAVQQIGPVIDAESTNPPVTEVISD